MGQPLPEDWTFISTMGFDTHKWEEVGVRRIQCKKCGHMIENLDCDKTDFPRCEEDVHEIETS